MTRVVWDKTGEKIYETGVDRGMLYLREDPFSETARARAMSRKMTSRVSAPEGYSYGVPWNGLTAVNDNPSGAEANKHYADNIPYLTLMSAEDLGATIEAFTYPRAFEVCEGKREMANGVIVGQQKREMFAFSYRTKVGNDMDGDSFGYKLHLYYGCLASPTSRNYSTINESPEPINFSWDVTTNPINMPGGFEPAASITFDTTTMTNAELEKLAAIEDILYGTADKEPRMVMPEELADLLSPDTAGRAARAQVSR